MPGVYGCGSGTYGQQGSGATSTVLSFTQRLPEETIAQVACTTSTTWVVTTDGKLFGCGRNNYGQQGDGTTTDVTSFTQRLSGKTIAQVVCSPYTTWAITTDGKLFGCGRNNYGQQGSGGTTDVTTFTQRLSNETIKEVVTDPNNSYTTWAITTDGKLFGCGRNMYGQQGRGDTANVTTFTQRLSNETIKKVVTYTTSDGTWVVTTDGKLFGCGRNNYSQQGSGDTANVTTFTQRLSNETIKEIAIGNNATWAVTTDGKLFGCGRNNFGQQGSGDTANVTTFTQRLSNETIKGIVTDLYGNNVWAITTNGKLFGCGENDYGQQGSGNTTNMKTFTQRLANETIDQIVCSPYTTWAITTDGKLFGCGRNDYGQQGSGDTTKVTTFTQRLIGETIDQIVCNSLTGVTQTTWVVTTDGKLFGCGNAENGQQGSGGTTNVTTFTQRLPDEVVYQVVCTNLITFVACVVASGATINVKVSGAWKSGKPYVKINGTWKETTKIFVKVNGEWKESV